MTALELLNQRLSAARRRRLANVALLSLPLLLGLGLASQLAADPALLWLAMALLVVIAFVFAVGWSRRLDKRWLGRQIDQCCPGMEDSSALLLGLEPARSPLAELQRQRLQQAAPDFELPDLREAWRWRAFAYLSGFVMVLLAAWVYWPGSASTAVSVSSIAEITETAPLQTTLGGELTVQPPSYTGLAESVHTDFEVEVAEASTLRWSLSLAPQPSAVTLVFHDRSELELELEESGRWVAQRQISESTFYRIDLAGAPDMADQRSWRIEMIADRPPQITVVEPERNLTVLERQQSRWPLRFEVTDDYGLGAATLSVTLAQGSGELIEVKERTVRLRGEGDARSRRYVSNLQLGAYGFARGDDLIVRLIVSDNRQPRAQTTRSPSYILRWPAELSADVGDIDGVAQRVMPTWFRSQRQIIIDTEALLERRGSLSQDEFVSESNEIGISQHALRLRYGQFLGEETEEVASTAGEDGEHHPNDGHDHPEDFFATQPVFGSAENVLEEYGHTHDYAEATTLFDPKTRRLLKAALDQMWRAEEQLRTGAPKPALPFEYAALNFIKQAQQAQRIYLARVGLELPPIDPSRRLTGDTRDLARPRDSLKAQEVDEPVEAVWRALSAANAATPAIDPELLDALDQWIAERGVELSDGLGLLALSDELRRTPDCVACARKLHQRLWSLLPTPFAAPASRASAGVSGQAYLRAIESGEQQ